MNEKDITKQIQEMRERAFPPLENFLPGETIREGDEVEEAEGAYLFRFDESLRPLVINIHGGGYVKGRSDRDRLYAAYVMRSAKVNVLDIDYPLAPENPFPAAMEMCYGIYKAVLAEPARFGCNGKVAIIGHSSGAVLALDVAFLAMERGLSEPYGIIADYPPVNMSEDPMDRLSEEEKQNERLVSRAETERLYSQLYAGNEDPANPYMSPIFMPKEKLQALPETMVVVGELDKLCGNAKAFSESAGCQFVSYPDTDHGFTTNRNGHWKEALDCHTAFLNKIFQKEKI